MINAKRIHVREVSVEAVVLKRTLQLCGYNQYFIKIQLALNWVQLFDLIIETFDDTFFLALARQVVRLRVFSFQCFENSRCRVKDLLSLVAESFGVISVAIGDGLIREYTASFNFPHLIVSFAGAWFVRHDSVLRPRHNGECLEQI